MSEIEYGPEDYVAVVKLTNGEEIVGLLLEDTGEYISIEHPYTLKYEPARGGVALLPWCLWSDDVMFHIQHDKILFVVTCIKRVADTYLDLVDAINNPVVDDISQFKSSLDKLGEYLEDEDEYDDPPLFIDGNNTKH